MIMATSHYKDKGYGNGVSMIIFAGIVLQSLKWLKEPIDYFVNIQTAFDFIHYCRYFDYRYLVDYAFSRVVQRAD